MSEQFEIIEKSMDLRFITVCEGKGDHGLQHEVKVLQQKVKIKDTDGKETWVWKRILHCLENSRPCDLFE